MKIINIFVAYLTYFLAPKTLLAKSFIGTLLQFGVRLPIDANNEIIDYLYDIYEKNKKIDKVMKRGGITTNMERMSDLIQYEAFFIKDILETSFISTAGHEFVLSVLEKYNLLNINKKSPNNLEILHFKDNEAAFEMINKYMDSLIIQDKPVVAISVQDMKKPSEPIMIQVGGDPPFYAHAATYYTGEHLIKKGDLLGVMPYEKIEHITSYMEGDERKQWLFIVISELNPKFHVTKKMWSIKNDFLEKAVILEQQKNKL